MQYNLVVVNPFLHFKKGDLISDPEMVGKILDPNHEYHSYESNARRVQAPEIRRELVSIAKFFNEENENHSDELDHADELAE